MKKLFGSKKTFKLKYKLKKYQYSTVSYLDHPNPSFRAVHMNIQSFLEGNFELKEVTPKSEEEIDDLSWTIPTLKSQMYSQIISAEMRLYNAPYTIPPEELGGPISLLTRKTDPLSLFYRGNAQLFERGYQFGRDFSETATDLIRSYLCSSKKPGWTHKINWLPNLYIFPQTPDIASNLPHGVAAAMNLASRKAMKLPVTDEFPKGDSKIFFFVFFVLFFFLIF